MIPKSYKPASWHCVLPVDPGGCMGLGFNVAGEVIRLRLSVDDVRKLAGAIVGYLPETITQEQRVREAAETMLLAANSYIKGRPE